METGDNEIKKILIVQIGKLGDMILTTPLFSNLKLLYPRCEITVLASTINFEIPRYHKDVDHILIYSKGSLKTIGLLMKLRQCKFDIWIDTKPEYSRTSRVLLKYGKPMRSYGYCKDDCLFDIDLAMYREGDHAVDINLAPMKALASDFTTRSKTPSIDIPGDTSGKVNEFLAPLKEKKILVNLSAGKTNRVWGKENWKELLTLLLKEGNYSIIVNAYGSGDKEMANELRIELDSSNIQVYSGEYMEIAEIVKHSAGVISPDTAIIHMASAFNVPVVGLYTDVKWNLERFAPLSEKQRILISPDKDSIKHITPDIVYRALMDIF